MGEELDNRMCMYSEEGEEIWLEFLDLIEYDDRQYVLFLPTESEENDEIVIMELLEGADDSDVDEYQSVDDPEILTAVFDIFKERFAENFKL